MTNASILHVDSMLPNENAYTNSVVVNVAVTCRHLTLELLGVLVPELRGLGIQRRVTETYKLANNSLIHCAAELPLASQVKLPRPYRPSLSS